ncbi:MAG: helix-turn-helix transcriptional regulator [Syntrophobacteraceae bacterium]
MLTISRNLKAAIKLGPERAYRVARRAGISPTTLSKLMNGIVEVKPDDPRVVAVGKVLGVEASKCFEQIQL